MGLYIRGMEMPTNCLECAFYRRTDPIYDYCCISSATPKGYVPKDCPLVPVPPHGRLIDADCCNGYFYEHMSDDMMIAAMNAINEMPTIIEAEENEHER